MKYLLSAPVILALLSTSAVAQPKQAGVLGPSSDPVFTELVQGSDGVVYRCKSDIKSVDGKPTRECLRNEDAEGAVFGSATSGGLALTPLAAGAGLVLVAIASDTSSGASTTTTTSTGF